MKHKLIAIVIVLFFVQFTFAQNVGVGTTTPIARFHVADSNVLFTGPVNVPTTTTYYPPVQGAGTRMMWYPQKAAFRVGYVYADQWDFNNIGINSLASGGSTMASGYGSTAIGIATTASGDYSTAMGQGTTASGFYSTATGQATTA